MNTRRQFLKQAGAASAVLSTLGTPLLGQEAAQPAAPKKTLRLGFVGVGVKGSSHVGNLLRMEGVELRAVCDIVDLQCRETQEQAKRLGKRPPTIYSRGERDFERMCAEEELDLVFTTTPWEVHVPVCLAAMENGKHAATEIPAAYTLEECWQLVATSEQTGRHLCMMENVNYMPDELSITLTHDTDSPRPYSRINLVQGTKGFVSDWPQMAVSLEILGNPHPPWEPGDKYRAPLLSGH